MSNKKNKIKCNWKLMVGIFLFATLTLSIAYAIYNIIITPPGTVSHNDNIRSGYTLMLIQCILGIIVMFIPSMIHRKWHIDIPNYMYILFYIFLYCAIYLGEIQKFYYTVTNWDDILHAFSGAMLGALGFSLFSVLNDAKHVKVNLSPFFIALFAFCFALSVGAIWEIYEYVFDGLFSINMQKYALENGTLLLGHAALTDTMQDIIIDALSALIISIIGFSSIKKSEGKKLRAEEIHSDEISDLKLELEDEKIHSLK